jgi:hypothetical protein
VEIEHSSGSFSSRRIIPGSRKAWDSSGHQRSGDQRVDQTNLTKIISNEDATSLNPGNAILRLPV